MLDVTDPDGPAGRGMRRALSLFVRAGLRGVWLRGTPPPGGFVFAANHHSWWDPFVAMALLHRLRRATCLLMWQENLDRYGFARPLGVFGTGERRRGLAFLRAGRVLVIYPEGELRPAGPPAPLAPGAAWYSVRARVPLCAAAVRVLIRGHQHPEAYVSLAPVPAGEQVPALTAALSQQLTTELAILDKLNAGADPRRALPGFTRVIRGRHSWDEQVDRVVRRAPWRR